MKSCFDQKYLLNRGPVLGLCLCILVFAGCAVTPKPLTPQEKADIVFQDIQKQDLEEDVTDAPITMEQAMARAIVHNLDHRTRMVEEAIAQGQFELAKFDMLPLLSGYGSYVWRSNEDASFSRGYWDRILSQSPTFSDDQGKLTGDLGLSWNVLDFGVSYYQAQQQADRYLISQGNRQKLIQRLMHQTRVAFVRAYAAQALRPDVKDTLLEAQMALEQLEILALERLQPPLTTLQNRRALLEVIGQLEAIEQSLVVSETELKSLTNIQPRVAISLQRPDTLKKPPVFQADIDKLEILALQNSLDITEQVYNARIERNESRKALLRLFPNLNFTASGKYDSNSYNVHTNWMEIGAHVSWNLIRLLSAPKLMEMSKVREDLAEVRRLAFNMAVITRLHISWQRYQDALNQMMRARELDELEAEITRHTEAAEEAEAGSQIERVRSQAGALRARLRHYEAQASTQEAMGNLLMSLGVDAVPLAFQTMTMEQLTEAISAQLAQWDAGILPSPIITSNLVLRDGVYSIHLHGHTSNEKNNRKLEE